MNQNITEFGNFLQGLLVPPPSESVVEWAEENVYVATGANQGRFSTRLIPYAREPIDRFGEKTCRNLVLCFGSQAAKSTILTVGTLYRIDRDPRDALWVSANTDLAKSFSKERWIPWVRNCPSVYQQVPKSAKGGEDKHRFGFLNQQFAGMNLNFVGSNSPANLASRPVGILILDETDKYAAESKYEAGALELVEERTKSYNFSFIAKASTPTVEGRVIWSEFLKTDMRYYHVPCPRCEQMIRLLFTVKSDEHGDCGVRWWRESPSESQDENGNWDMAKVASNAFYRCQKCGGEIYDYERHPMIEAGQWVPTNPNAPEGCHGYQLSSLYSVLSEATSFSSIAVKWLQAGKQIGGRQNFVNSWLAETWDLERSVDQVEVVHEEYTTEQIAKDSVSLMSVDVQENHFWTVIRRFAKPTPDKPFGESWLIVADRLEDEGQISQLQQEHGVLGENLILDIARRPNAVGRLICEHNWRGMLGVDMPKKFDHPVAGGARVQRMYSTVNFRDPYLGTGWEGRRPERARYVKFHKGSGLDLLSSLRFHSPTIWHTHANAHDKYQRHLNAFVKRSKIGNRGQTEYYWQALHRDDHLADCEVMVLIRALQMGLITVPGEVAEM